MLLPVSLLINLTLIGDTMEKDVFQVFIDGDTEKLILRSSEAEKGIQYYFLKY